MLSRKRQIEVGVSGGLGNQLFAYFAGLYLSQVGGRELIMNFESASKDHSAFDIRSFKEVDALQVVSKRIHTPQKLKKVSDSFKYRYPAAMKILELFTGIYVDSGIESNISKSKSYLRRIGISGNFQDFQYFDNLGNQNLTLMNISSNKKIGENSKTLGIHIRRGDFIAEKLTHGCLSSDWYQSAVLYLTSTNSDIKRIIVFSNDDEWVRQNMHEIFPNNQIPVEIKEFDPYEDPAHGFMEFANCEFKICANSTFSLLAAKLIPGLTVVPYPYNRAGNFKALEESSPKNWIRIPSIWEE